MCGEAEVTSEYWGETGRSAFKLFLKPVEDVVKLVYAKHLVHHPDHHGDIT